MKLTWIEAGRGIAALLVVLFHASETIHNHRQILPFGGFFTFGFSGVEFFFVLSGFIISYVHHRDIGRPNSFISFARKRLLRIYPIYWVALLIHLAVLIAAPSLGHTQLWTGLVVKSIILFPQPDPPVVFVGWTLQNELLFYSIFPVLIFIRKLGYIFFGVWFAGILMTLIFQWQLEFPLSFVLNIRNLGFFFGMAIAYVLLRSPKSQVELVIMGVGLYLIIGVLFVRPANDYQPSWVFPMFDAAAALLIFGVATWERGGNRRAPGWLVGLGAASYSIYLIHLPVIWVLNYYIDRIACASTACRNGQFVMLTSFSVFAGLLLHAAVERPILRKLM